MHENSQQFLKIQAPSISDQSFQFKLGLSPHISEKTVFKIVHSNKLQHEAQGPVLFKDKIFIAYSYDKLMQKDLFLFTETKQLDIRKLGETRF